MFTMQRLNYEVKKGEPGEPVIIEISVPFDRMIRYCLASIDVHLENVAIEHYAVGAEPRLRFVCPDFPKHRIEEFYWRVGEWYIRYHPLLNVPLN